MQDERKRLNIKAPEPWISPRQTRVVNFFSCGKVVKSQSFGKGEPPCRSPVGGISPAHECLQGDETEPDTDTEPEAAPESGLESEMSKVMPSRQSQPKPPSAQTALQSSFGSLSIEGDLLAMLDKQPSHNSRSASAHVRHTDDNEELLSAQLSLSGMVDYCFPSNTQVQREIEASTAADGRPSSPYHDNLLLSRDQSIQTQLQDRSHGDMMPPPRASCGNIFLAVQPVTRQVTSPLEPWDFELSTQDFRDVAV